jgi:hypothetical protein
MSAHACSFTIYLGAPSMFRANAFIQLSKLCHRYCGGSYSIETIDVRAEKRMAFLAGVSDTPTIFVTVPGLKSQRIGNIATTELFLKKLSSPPHRLLL